MGNAVWANTGTSPTSVCDDARLAEAPELSYPQGTSNGQAGWDVGLSYGNSSDLLDKLSKVKQAKGPITRLALNSHGGPGCFDIDGVLPREMPRAESPEEKALLAKCLSVDTLDNFKSVLDKINGLLADGAPLILMGCLAAAGKEGSELLIKLSTVFRGHMVAGFVTVGVSRQSLRPGTSCNSPGMRETEFQNHNPDDATTEARYSGGALLAMPWAWEWSANAKQARDGALTKAPSEADSPRGLDYLLDAKWKLELPVGGKYAGVLSFDMESAGIGNVWWAEYQGPQHVAKWSEFGGTLTFKFTTDPLKRLFSIKLPFSPLIRGTASQGPSPIGLVKVD